MPILCYILANLRPIVLLTLLRKVLSVVLLNRVRAKVDGYLSASQAGFRIGRSTADIVWAHRWLAAKVIRYKQTVHILGLDMSRAFDTIDRAKLMLILREEVQLTEDDLRICQSLLADTSLTVKLGEVLSDPFQTTIGTPQGDGISPILFAVYLESAIRLVRAQVMPRPAADVGIPPELIYADDTDFPSTSQSFLRHLEQIIPPTIGPNHGYHLRANDTKWERTAIVPPADGRIESRLTDEQQAWRKTKKLGSQLGDEEDIERRMLLATSAFKSLRKLWEQRKVTRIGTRMQAYNALVLSVLLYNCGTWGITQGVMERLEVYHRRHLREVLGVRTQDVSNAELYKRCKTSPLQGRIAWERWSLFGHVLRLALDTPAQLAMDYYCQLSEGEVISQGRPITTLPIILFRAYRKYRAYTRERGWSVLTETRMLTELRKRAADKQKWRELAAFICDSKHKLDVLDSD